MERQKILCPYCQTPLEKEDMFDVDWANDNEVFAYFDLYCPHCDKSRGTVKERFIFSDEKINLY